MPGHWSRRGWWVGAQGTAQSPSFLKSILFYFVLYFNKITFKRRHAENAGISAKIHVLEPLKLQNILRPQQGLGRS